VNKRRNVIIALGAGALVAPFRVLAQPAAARVYRIGVLNPASASIMGGRIEVLRAALREYGYVEGKNLVIDLRWGERNYDELPRLAAELITLKPDVLITHARVSTVAAQKATTTIPIVMVSVSEPDALGLVSNLQRPGGNVTGFANFNSILYAKRIELLKESQPQIRRIAFTSGPATAALTHKAVEAAAQSLKLELQLHNVTKPDQGQIDEIIAALIKRRADAFVASNEPIFQGQFNQSLARFGEKHRMPSAGASEFAESGGMIGYNSDALEPYRRAAFFINRIITGTSPGEIPVELPSKFELVVNMKTARLLGIKIPNSILLRATKVIE
jgi:putative ABC transport system substrate-binding protein